MATYFFLILSSGLGKASNIEMVQLYPIRKNVLSLSFRQSAILGSLGMNHYFPAATILIVAEISNLVEIRIQWICRLLLRASRTTKICLYLWLLSINSCLLFLEADFGEGSLTIIHNHSSYLIIFLLVQLEPQLCSSQYCSTSIQGHSANPANLSFPSYSEVLPRESSSVPSMSCNQRNEQLIPIILITKTKYRPSPKKVGTNEQTQREPRWLYFRFRLSSHQAQNIIKSVCTDT